MDDDLESMLLGIHDDHHEEKADRQDIQRAPFGYLGSKFKSIHQLKKHLPYSAKWVDHFTGSGIVTLNRQESELEVMNDRYSGIVAFYRCLQDKTKLKALLDRLNLAPQSSREEFYYCKNTWCDEIDDVERAAKWFYMVRLSVMGKGHCFGRQVNPPVGFPLAGSLELFWPIHYRLRRVIIENLDFETCFKDYDSENCVHYCDPPYIGTDPGIYAGSSWTRDDLARLLRCCEKARGFVALSGYADEQIDACTFWSKRVTWKIASMAETNAFSEENNKAQYRDIKQKTEVEEVLWIKD
jgi:DNA adenine methylase